MFSTNKFPASSAILILVSSFTSSHAQDQLHVISQYYLMYCNHTDLVLILSSVSVQSFSSAIAEVTSSYG